LVQIYQCRELPAGITSLKGIFDANQAGGQINASYHFSRGWDCQSTSKKPFCQGLLGKNL